MLVDARQLAKELAPKEPRELIKSELHRTEACSQLADAFMFPHTLSTNASVVPRPSPTPDHEWIVTLHRSMRGFVSGTLRRAQYTGPKAGCGLAVNAPLTRRR